MSDVELRDLERRWRASGAVEDEARWHVARVRAGALEPERLALAAWTGWPGAALAVQGEPQVAATTSWVRRLFGGARPAQDPLARGLPGLADWLQSGLREAPPEAQRRAALAEVERVGVSLLEARLARTGGVDAEPSDAIPGYLATEAADAPAAAWLRAAHAVLRDAAHAATDALLTDASIDPPQRLQWLDGPPSRQGLTLYSAAWGPTLQALACAGRKGKTRGRADSWWGGYGSALARKVSASAGAEARAWGEAVRAAQRAALAPWALGLSDPLRERAASALDALEIASPCPLPWDGLRAVDPAARVRDCDRCQQRVHDLSALSRPEAEALLAAHAGQRLCVRLYRRLDGRVLTRDCGAGIDALVDQGAPRHELLGMVAGPLDQA